MVKHESEQQGKLLSHQTAMCALVTEFWRLEDNAILELKLIWHKLCDYETSGSMCWWYKIQSETYQSYKYISFYFLFFVFVCGFFFFTPNQVYSILNNCGVEMLASNCMHTCFLQCMLHTIHASYNTFMDPKFS